jgi:hypothetical protein
MHPPENKKAPTTQSELSLRFSKTKPGEKMREAVCSQPRYV